MQHSPFNARSASGAKRSLNPVPHQLSQGQRRPGMKKINLAVGAVTVILLASGKYECDNFNPNELNNVEKYRGVLRRHG